jgi:multimeric flavodoxin WrbA
MTTVRKGQAPAKLNREQFHERFAHGFYDPAFDTVARELAAVEEVAWQNYVGKRKAPRTVKAGPGFADPDYDLSVEWKETRDRLLAAEAQQQDPASRSRVLLICGAARNDGSCPGEISKTWRLTTLARQILDAQDIETDVLDLSWIISDYDRHIHPCKACVATAMPLCHWPCSCYPNHAEGQTNDWMNEIYERWVRAHGIIILTPVYWYQAPSVLKLMIDRLVCADGGNPDPSSTPWQACRRGQGAGTGRLGLPEAPGQPDVRAGGARRRGRHRNHAPLAGGLARLDGTGRRRQLRAARPLHRLLRIVRRQP